MATTRQLILAIDLGTSGVKAAVVASDGSLLSKGRAAVETMLLPDNGAEQDPEAVWGAVVHACRQAVGAAGRPADITGVACCSQYSSIVPVDASGRPTGNMILWMDGRGTPGALRSFPGGRRMVAGPLQLLRFLHFHGIPPLDSGGDSLAHMRWIKLARPEVYERTATFLEPMDFITMRLTGRATSNPCSAFLMLLVDNRRLRAPRYAPSLVAASGIDPRKLPELLPVDADVGTVKPEVASELGISAGARVFGGINDTQAGAAGCFAFSGNHAGVSIGTTSVLVTHVDFKRTAIRTAIASMPSPIPGGYLVTAENGIGGQAVEHFLNQLVFAADEFGDHSVDDKFAALNRAVEKVKAGSSRVLFLPWLRGSLAPAEDGRVRGGFLNLALDTTREQLARAVLEGVALNFRWLLGAVESFTRRRLDRLVFYGGGAVSDAWSQVFADVVRLPVHQVEDPRFTICRGVALLGFHRTGEVKLDDLERLAPIRRVYQPASALASHYDLMFEQFVNAFRRNRQIFRALNARIGGHHQEAVS